MSAQMRPRSLAISDYVYGLLLRIYPARFRHAFGEEMAQVFRDICRDQFSRNGVSGLLRIWVHTLSDWIKSVCEQHVQEAFQMSGKEWMIRIGGIAAIVGGILGIYYVIQAPNQYGNYGWNGRLAFVVPLLFTLGIGGGMALFDHQLSTLGRSGILIIGAGLILQSAGLLFAPLWALSFLGPIIIVPVGAILLGRNNLQRIVSPAWWRNFPFLLLVIAVMAFGIEIYEEMIGASTPDRGVQLAEALFSLSWLGLGIGLWLRPDNRADDTPLAA